MLAAAGAGWLAAAGAGRLATAGAGRLAALGAGRLAALGAGWLAAAGAERFEFLAGVAQGRIRWHRAHILGIFYACKFYFTASVRSGGGGGGASSLKC